MGMDANEKANQFNDMCVQCLLAGIQNHHLTFITSVSYWFSCYISNWLHQLVEVIAVKQMQELGFFFVLKFLDV
jgi:hypothetical protein